MPLHPQRAERRRPPLTADGCWLGVTSQLRAEGGVSSRPGRGGRGGEEASDQLREGGGWHRGWHLLFFFFAAGWRGQRPTQGGRVVGGREREEKQEGKSKRRWEPSCWLSPAPPAPPRSPGPAANSADSCICVMDFPSLRPVSLFSSRPPPSLGSRLPLPPPPPPCVAAAPVTFL